MADNTTLNTGTGGDVIATDDVGGVKHQRVKVEFGADGSATDVAPGAPLPTFSRHDGRTFVNLWALAVAAGATGVETAITLNRVSAAGAAATTGTSFVVTSGKRFRLVELIFSTRGNATATAQATTFSLRVNTAGATTTTSNPFLQARSATSASALVWDRFKLDFGADGPEIVGDGTLTFGVTAQSTYTTNAPTWDVQITGYEY